MKKLILLLLGLVTILNTRLFGQECVSDDCNPFISGMGYSIGCVPTGGTAVLEVGWGINSVDGTCTAPAGSWQIAIQFPGTGIYGIGDVSAVSGGEQFNWTYNPATKLLLGISNKPLGFNINGPQSTWYADGGTISVTVKGIISNNCVGLQSSAQIVITAPPLAGNCLAAFQNLVYDDNLMSLFGVAVPTSSQSVDFSTKQIRFFPNPAKNYIKIGFDDYKLPYQEVTIELLDISGKKFLHKVYRLNKDGNVIKIDLPDAMAGGTYICTVKKGEIMLASKNIVVIR